MNTTLLQGQYLYKAVSAQSGLPLEFLDAGRSQMAAEAALNDIGTELVGQEQSLEKLRVILHARLLDRAAGWQRALETLEIFTDRRPVLCCLALGPTGIGKSQTARLLAQQFYGGKIITLNASEVGHEAPHGVATWVGSPPGYVGSTQGGSLTDGLRAHQACVILVDEVEKASIEAITNILLPLMGDGVVTDRNNGDTLQATHCIVFCTSNIAVHDEASSFTRLRRFLPAEIIGRFNAVLHYRALSDAAKWEIFERLLEEQQSRHRVHISLQEDAQHWVESRLHNSQTGARGISDFVSTHVVPLIVQNERGVNQDTLSVRTLTDESGTRFTC